MDLKEIVSCVCGKVTWGECKHGDMAGSITGFVSCPGEASHTSPTKEDHTAVFFSKEGGVPFVTCFHNNCREQVAQLNSRLRAYIEDAIASGELDMEIPQPTEEMRQAASQRAAITARMKAIAAQVTSTEWTMEQMRKESVRNPDTISTPGEFLLALFQPKDIVWIGEPNWTGSEYSRNNFKPVYMWAEMSKTGRTEWPPFTCGSTFRPGSTSRSNNSVLYRRYLIVEHDDMPKEKFGGLLKWAKTKGLPLKMVVDSGNKSLHGWFEWRGDAIMEGWRTAFKALGCDPKTLRATQPVRLGQAIRKFTDGRPSTVQKVLYVGA